MNPKLEERVTAFMDKFSGKGRYSKEADFFQSFLRALHLTRQEALEEATKIKCDMCENDWPLNENLFHFDKHTAMNVKCNAEDIRQLAKEEI